jgi:hypothetical protein
VCVPVCVIRIRALTERDTGVLQGCLQHPRAHCAGQCFLSSCAVHTILLPQGGLCFVLVRASECAGRHETVCNALHDHVGMLQALTTAGHVWTLQDCQLPVRSSVAVSRAAAVKL